MTQLTTQNYNNPSYTVGHYGNTEKVYRQLPALFNDSWLDGVFEHLERAFDVPNAVYPYNVLVNKDKSGEPLEYIIEVALAGIGKQNIDVKVRDNRLHILIHRDERESEGDSAYVKRGVSKRAGQLSFTLNENTNVKKINSTYTDGMLRVNVPVVQPEVVNVDIKVN
jgi:HSP20 family molecular chaperone IbpA